MTDEWVVDDVRLGDAKRRAHLLSPPTPGDLISLVGSHCSSVQAELRVDQMGGLKRVIGRFPIDAGLFDWLWNSSSGYRAHYLRSPDEGEDFNRRIVEPLGQTLAVQLIRMDHLNLGRALASVLGPHGKIWPPYDWEAFALGPAAIRPVFWMENIKRNDIMHLGLRAATMKSPGIEFKGTFVDNQERAVRTKSHRADELHLYGIT